MSPTGSFPQCSLFCIGGDNTVMMGCRREPCGRQWALYGSKGTASSRPPAEPEQASQKTADEEAAESVVITLGSPQQIYQHRQAR